METKDFLDKLNEGSDSALEELFRQYFEKLRSLATREMGPHVRAEPDSIVMSVMGSMVRGFRDGRFHVSDSRRLWNLLVTITLNKIRKRVEKRPGEESLSSERFRIDVESARRGNRRSVRYGQDPVHAPVLSLQDPPPRIRAVLSRRRPRGPDHLGRQTIQHRHPG
jgi:hypothetical protein